MRVSQLLADNFEVTKHLLLAAANEVPRSSTLLLYVPSYQQAFQDFYEMTGDFGLYRVQSEPIESRVDFSKVFVALTRCVSFEAI